MVVFLQNFYQYLRVKLDQFVFNFYVEQGFFQKLEILVVKNRISSIEALLDFIKFQIMPYKGLSLQNLRKKQHGCINTIGNTTIGGRSYNNNDEMNIINNNNKKDVVEYIRWNNLYVHLYDLLLDYNIKDNNSNNETVTNILDITRFSDVGSFCDE